MPDPQQRANQPFALAIRRSREGLRLTQADYGLRMGAEVGFPIGSDRVSKWEAGISLQAGPGRWTVVPAWAIGAAARISGRAIGELMAGDGESLQGRMDELAERVRTLEVLMARLRAAGLLPGVEDERGTDTHPVGDRPT